MYSCLNHRTLRVSATESISSLGHGSGELYFQTLRQTVSGCLMPPEGMRSAACSNGNHSDPPTSNLNFKITAQHNTPHASCSQSPSVTLFSPLPEIPWIPETWGARRMHLGFRRCHEKPFESICCEAGASKTDGTTVAEISAASSDKAYDAVTSPMCQQLDMVKAILGASIGPPKATSILHSGSSPKTSGTPQTTIPGSNRICCLLGTYSTVSGRVAWPLKRQDTVGSCIAGNRQKVHAEIDDAWGLPYIYIYAYINKHVHLHVYRYMYFVYVYDIYIYTHTETTTNMILRYA